MCANTEFEMTENRVAAVFYDVLKQLEFDPVSKPADTPLHE